MSHARPRPSLVITFGLFFVVSCGLFSSRPPAVVSSVPVNALAGHDKVSQDVAPKEELRLVPAEAYMRTYLQLFGGLAPLDVQKRAKGADGGQLFDVWDDYLATLGFPDYRNDLPRANQTNALMVSTFERLGVALCDRAVEHDWKPDRKTKKTVPVKDRLIFEFDLPPTAPDAAAFAPRFDVLHRTFLGYPAALAPTDRTLRFFKLYGDVVMRHSAPTAAQSRLSPAEIGWANVCYALIRHPEFHLY